MAIIDVPEFKNVKITKACLSDLERSLRGFGGRGRFERWFYAKLEQLNDPKFPYRDFPRIFEPVNGLYAITYRNSQKNIRILYHVEKNGIIKLLLSSFLEKDTKADYKFFIAQAKKRLKDERKVDGI